MKKEKEQKVPVLRFPEFDGEWGKMKLGKISYQITSGSRDWAQFYTPTGDKFIRMTNLQRDGNIRLILDDLKYVTLPENSTEGARTSLQPGDILISITAELGKIGLIPEDLGKAYINQHMALVRPKTDATEPKFIAYSLAQPSSNKRFNRLNDSGAKAGLNLGAIRAFFFSVPPLPEQQKIASFLSAVDTKIEQLRKKKGLLEQYKKGIMQKLFSQEIRFKDEHWNDFPEWKTRYFGELYEFKPTNSFSRNQLNYKTGQVRNIHYGDIHTKFKPKFELFREDVPFINPDINIDNIQDDKFCKEGDLIIADASEDYAAIGKTIEIISLNGEKVLSGLHTLLARPSTNCIYIGYSSYMLVSSSVRKQIKLIAQGAKVLSISSKRMEKIKVPIPSPEEQRKIAEFLSSIDKKIDLVATELTHAQTFKKGLLQQMFI